MQDVTERLHLNHDDHHTPDNEELSEQTECFQCRKITPPGQARGLAVAEGIVLCHACCLQRGAKYDRERAIWTMMPWFNDLTGHV